jgi:hypothetical protein
MSSFDQRINALNVSLADDAGLFEAVKGMAIMKGGQLVSAELSSSPAPVQVGGRVSMPIQFFGGPTPGAYVANGNGSSSAAAPDAGLARPALTAFDAYASVGGSHKKAHKWVSQAELERCIDMRGLKAESKRRIARMVNEHVDAVVERAASLVKNKKRVMGKSHIRKAMKSM